MPRRWKSSLVLAIALCLAWIAPADAQTCTAPPPPTVTVIEGSNPSCLYGPPIVFEASPGYASYVWNDGSTAQTRTWVPNSAGRFYISVRGIDANGCSSDPAYVVVSVGPLEQVDIHLDGSQEFCHTSTGGLYTVTHYGGGPSTHQWSYSTPREGPFTPIAGATGSTYRLRGSDFPAPGGYWINATVTPSCGTSMTSYAQWVNVVDDLNPPQIWTVDRICETGVTNAQLGVPYDSVLWTITNGRFINDGYWGCSDDPTRDCVRFEPTGTGDITLSVTATSGDCSVNSSKVIPVGALDPPPIYGPETGLCAGQQGWASTEYGWEQYQWSVTNATINGSTTEYFINFTPDGSGLPVTVTLTETENITGCASSNSITVATDRAITPPAIQLTNPPSCAGASGSVTVDPPAGEPNWQYVEWSISNGEIEYVSPTYETMYFVSASGATTITAIVTDGWGCPATSTLEISVPPSGPPATFTLSSPDVCAGGESRVQLNPPTEGYEWLDVQWSIVNGTGAPSPNDYRNFDFIPSGAGPVTISVEAVNGLGCRSTGSVEIPLRAIAAPEIVEPVPSTCPNSESMVRLNPPAEGGQWLDIQWSITNGTGAPNPNDHREFSFTTGNSGTVTITAVATDEMGCSVTASRNIALENVAASITGPSAFCAGQSATLTASDGTDYLWSTGETTQSITVTAAGNYTVTMRTAAGCLANASHDVTIHDVPPASIMPNGPTTFCNGGSVVLTASAGTSYLWSNGATTQSITVDASGTFSVSVTDSNGCSSTSGQVTVTEHDVPVATISAPEQACLGSTQQASGPAGFAAYAWAIYGGTITSDPTQQNITFVPTYDGWVRLTLTVTDANGCTSATAQQYVLGVTASYIYITASTPMCVESTGTASVTTARPDNSRYDWTITHGTITLIHDDQGQIDPNGRNISFRSDGSGNPVVLNVTETDKYGCVSTATKTVNFRATTPPDFSVAANVCPTANSTATSSLFADYYEWTVTNATIVSGQYARTLTYNATGAGPVGITLTIRDSNYCLTSNTKTVPLRTIAPPALSGSTAVCPNGNGYASVSGNYDSVVWSVTNGTLLSSSLYTANFRANGSGAVTVTATVNSGGCTNTNSIAIPIEDLTPPPMTAPESICYGGRFTASIPEGNYRNVTWNWSGAWLAGNTSNFSKVFQHDTPASGPTPTQVTLTIDLETWSMCHIIVTKVIPLGPPTTRPTIAFDVPANFCAGMTGTASVSNGPYTSYEWSITGGTITSAANGASVSFVPDDSGTTRLAVNVLDGRGDCDAQESAAPPMANSKGSITSSGATNLCPNESVTLTAPLADSYLWSTGATTPSITVSEAGSYTVDTTKNGCTVTSYPRAVTVTSPAATLTPDAASYCAGGSTMLRGSVTGLRGQSHYHYYYATDSPSALHGGYNVIGYTANANYTRTYYMIVRDETGCEVRSPNVTITVNPKPEATITPSGPTTFCEGGNVTLSAPAGMSSYAWSNGATTQSITVAQSGSYTVTVTDANGCSSATSSPTTVTVNVPPATPVITASGATTFCEGGNVMLSAPAGYSYSWSNGATTQSITVAQSGNYSVTVTNANGCSSATSSPATVTVSAPPATPVITASGATTFCEGGNVTLTAPAGYTYSWSNGATTQSITVAQSGSYSVTVTDANGCSATSAATTVTVHDEIGIAWVNIPQVCNGVETTATTQAFRNGLYIDDVTYVWSITGGTITSQNGKQVTFVSTSSAVTLSVTATDANGCSASMSRTEAVPAAVDATITASGPTTFCAGNSVTLSARAGYSYYSWSTGATTPSITVGESGSYTVTVANAEGCEATSNAVTVTVNALPTPTISADGATTFCQGEDVTLTASAGASYLWSTGATTQSITVNASGNYSVTVTDANGCSAASNATAVTVNALPTPTISADGATTFCQGDDVTLTASAGASYLWSTGATSQSITVNASGSYSVTVTNAAGCSATSNATVITVNPLPQPGITAEGPTTFCDGGSVTLTASEGASYLWSTGATSRSIIADATNVYTVTVTNAQGCSATSPGLSVVENAKPDTPTISADGPITFCAGNDVRLTAPASASYLWSTGATSQFIDVSQSGSYTVMVFNAAGCSATSSATTVIVNPATAISNNPQNATIPKNTTTTLTVTASGMGTLTYQWYRGSSGNTSSPISGATSSSYTTTKLTRGVYTYWVRVTGSCGAVNSTTATITAQ